MDKPRLEHAGVQKPRIGTTRIVNPAIEVHMEPGSQMAQTKRGSPDVGLLGLLNSRDGKRGSA
jgi:hypothetical protein